ncbi:squalene/phytoene synthase family protein [Streptomyces sp. B1I3]|uniref:squalene/phytoene synthase family protein n=1 Tax=Streptomyces sp. B1I3 TaxID=3042264 RepID=UPI0027D788C9|nr:squalene/phytoene synthase family protein [Streptomyces sp. B1I3]
MTRFLMRTDLTAYGAVRVLSPAEFQPHLLAGFAFASFTDDVCDQGGSAQERSRRFDLWTTQVRAGLETGRAEHPLLRAFLHTSGVCSLPRRWIDSYLTGTRIDLDFPGFTNEADYQSYIDQLTWPFVMLTTGLVQPDGEKERFAESCRLFADGCQRTDFLADLAEDLRGGRLYLPVDDLRRHGVTRCDLEHGRDTPEVRALIAETAEAAHATLREAGRIVDEIADSHRPLMRCVLRLHHHRLDTITALGTVVTRRPPRVDPMACLRVLAQERPANVSAPRASR